MWIDTRASCVIECDSAMVLGDVCLQLSIRVGATLATTEERAEGLIIRTFANALQVTQECIAKVGMLVHIVCWPTTFLNSAH